MRKSLFVVIFILIGTSFANAQSSSASTTEAFSELMSYVRSCPLLEPLRKLNVMAKTEANLAKNTTTQSFMPRARFGIDERENSDQLDTVQVLRLQGNVSLNEIINGYKVADFQASAEKLNADIRIHEGLSGIVGSFFKWRALSNLRTKLEELEKYYSRKKNPGKSKLTYLELSKQTEALLIRSRINGYQTQILFYEKLFADCSKSINLKNPWEINISYEKLSPEVLVESLDNNSKRRDAIEKKNCQARSDLRGARIDKENGAWYPKLYYGWSRETGSKIYPDRSGWNVGLEIAIPFPGESAPAFPVDECQIKLQNDNIRDADRVELAKLMVKELTQITTLRNRWSEVMQDSIEAFSLEARGSAAMSSAISQFERLNIQIAELETELAMSSLAGDQ